MAMNPRLLVPRATGFVSPDADARTYLAAVRVADGSNLEPAVAKAISDFVIGCKTDGIWDAIKASCILAGARTLSGALTPLKGTAPSNVNNNFVSANYNRKTGLLGDGSTKYLDTNRSLSSDPQNNFHMSVNIHTLANNTDYMGDFDSGNGNLLQQFSGFHFGYIRSGTAVSQSSGAVGFFGLRRTTSSASQIRSNGATTTSGVSSVAPPNRNAFVFCRNGPAGATSYSASRLTFYSIGESLDLTLLETRVSALITAIGNAIP